MEGAKKVHCDYIKELWFRKEKLRAAHSGVAQHLVEAIEEENGEHFHRRLWPIHSLKRYFKNPSVLNQSIQGAQKTKLSPHQ
jgi:hypothetical protein